MFTKTLIATAMMAGLMSAAVDAKPTKAENKAQMAKTAELNRQQLASAGAMGAGAMGQSQGSSMGAAPSAEAPSTMTEPAPAASPADMSAPPATDMATPPEAPTPPQG